MTFPTEYDLKFWQYTKKPKFAKNMKDTKPSIHKVINSHTDTEKVTASELEVMNLINGAKRRLKDGVYKDTYFQGGHVPELPTLEDFLMWYSASRPRKRVVALRWIRKMKEQS